MLPRADDVTVPEHGGAGSAVGCAGGQNAPSVYGAAGAAADYPDVRLTLNSIDLANATIEAATLARDLARKNVEAEQQKYELGTITAFEVLDSQTRLSTSESALLNAYVGYQQAFVSYQRATWTLLDGLGMVLEIP